MNGTAPAEAPLDATVVICSRNRRELLADTVESVLAAAAVPREILVVDQSDAPHASLARKGTVRGCAVTYIHSQNVGLSRARNVGLRAAACDVVVLIDDDMLVEPEWLRPLLDGRRAAGPGGVATGRVLPAPAEGTAGVPPAALVTREVAATYRGRQPGDVMPGANVAVDRHVVLAVGGYDERLGAGTRYSAADDNDMGYRLLLAGCEVRHVPEAVVLHRAWRSKAELLRLRWNYGRGKGAFYAKHMRRGDAFMVKRLLADLGRRSRRALRALPGSPRSAAAEGVSAAAVVAGMLGWTIRERCLPLLAGRTRGA